MHEISISLYTICIQTHIYLCINPVSVYRIPCDRRYIYMNIYMSVMMITVLMMMMMMTTVQYYTNEIKPAGPNRTITICTES